MSPTACRLRSLCQRPLGVTDRSKRLPCLMQACDCGRERYLQQCRHVVVGNPFDRNEENDLALVPWQTKEAIDQTILQHFNRAPGTRPWTIELRRRREHVQAWSHVCAGCPRATRLRVHGAHVRNQLQEEGSRLVPISSCTRRAAQRCGDKRLRFLRIHRQNPRIPPEPRQHGTQVILHQRSRHVKRIAPPADPVPGPIPECGSRMHRLGAEHSAAWPSVPSDQGGEFTSSLSAKRRCTSRSG